MLKGIIFLLEIIVFLIVVLIITLMFGINLKNLSYGNVHIAKLYIKYDKKLILNFDKLTIDGKKYNIDLNLNANTTNVDLDIKNLDMTDFNLSLKGEITSTYEELKEYKNGNIQDLTLNNLVFYFDKKLEPIKAKKLHIKKENDDIYLSFKLPTLDGIKLDGSEVALKKLGDYYKLFLDLKTNNLLDKKLIKLVKHYGISLPVVQKSGDTTINFKMGLPFRENAKLDIYTKVDIQNGKLLFGDIELKPKDLSVLVKGTKVDIKSNEIDIVFAGTNYKGINLQTTIENFKVNTTLDVYDESNNSFTVYDTTEFPNLKSYGKAYINSYDKNQIKLDSEKVKYEITYNPQVKVKVFGDVDLSVVNEKLKLSKLNVDIVGKFFDITTDLIDKNNNNFTIYNKTDLDKQITYGNIYLNNFKHNDLVNINAQMLEYSVEHEPLFVKVSSDFSSSIKDKQVDFSSFNLHFFEGKVFVKSYINHDDQKIKIDTVTDINKKQSKGDVILLHLTHKDLIKLENQPLTYRLDFNESIHLDVPQIGLNYELKNDTHNVVIEKPSGILNRVKYLRADNQAESKIKIFSNNNFELINVIIDKVNLDINSTLFKSDKKEESKVSYPDLNVKLFNSNFKYDNLALNVALADVKTTGNKLFVDFKPQGETSSIKLQMFEKNYAIQAKGISDKFINSILKKRWFRKGKFDMDFKGNLQTINGRVDIHDTTVRKMHVLQNLITFVNTTPAIINPLLALPTLFRLGETNFDMGGYYIRKGHVVFNHDINRKYTNITSMNTNSKMMDFKGKGYVDLLNEKLLFKMDIIFLKDYSSAINEIPILGYIVTGNDGNFVTHVDIKGNFEKQSFESHAVKDAGTGVLNVIKRTLTVPFLPFMSEEDKKEEE